MKRKKEEMMITRTVTTDGELLDVQTGLVESPDYCKLLRTTENSNIVGSLTYRGLQYYIAIQKALPVNEITVTLDEVQQNFFDLFCKGVAPSWARKIEQTGRREAIEKNLIYQSRENKRVFAVNPAVFSTQEKQNTIEVLRLYREIQRGFLVSGNQLFNIQGNQFLFNSSVTINITNTQVNGPESTER